MIDWVGRKTLQHTHMETLQHTHMETPDEAGQRATHYNTLQHIATHCITLQHAASHYNTHI